MIDVHASKECQLLRSVIFTYAVLRLIKQTNSTANDKGLIPALTKFDDYNTNLILIILLM